MFMASGIHLNDVFPGPKYTNTQKISFDNNILVRCGTNDDSWHEDLAAIDIKGGVRNVVFNNTKIYDSPFDAIRVMSGPTGIEFKNTEILGASLAGQTTKYSTWEHSTGAIRLDVDGVKFSNGIKIANVSEDKIKNNQTWPIWTDNNKARAAAIGYEYLSDATYKVPDFPEADTSQQGGIVNPLEGIKGYDVDLQGLRWENTDGSTSLKEGDAVTFKFALTNVSNVDIPAGVNLGVKVTVDGQESFVTTSYKKGLKAKQTIILTTQTAWKAVAGGHVVKAEADYRNRLTDELTRDNNNREKKFNVAENEDDGDYTPVTGGYDLVVTKVAFDKKTINPGDEVRFTATIVNAGDRDVPAGTKLGVQFQIDGNTSVITWNDKHYSGLKSHQKITLSATGGTNGKSTWTATNGVHTLTAWVNDTHDYRDEVNGSDDANKKSIELKIPLGAVRFFSASEVSSPDDLNNLNQANAIDRVKGRTEAEGAYYDLQGNKVATTKENLKPGLYIHNGKKIIVR